MDLVTLKADKVKYTAVLERQNKSIQEGTANALRLQGVIAYLNDAIKKLEEEQNAERRE